MTHNSNTTNLTLNARNQLSSAAEEAEQQEEQEQEEQQEEERKEEEDEDGDDNDNDDDANELASDSSIGRSCQRLKGRGGEEDGALRVSDDDEAATNSLIGADSRQQTADGWWMVVSVRRRIMLRAQRERCLWLGTRAGSIASREDETASALPPRRRERRGR